MPVQQLYAQLHGSGGASGFKDTVRFQELYRTQGEQLQQTRATVERLNDELVALEIENNLLQSRVDQLEAENAGLVERWLARVQQEVDGLNLKNG
jgi:predicted nuclease with TOPRIM domain